MVASAAPVNGLNTGIEHKLTFTDLNGVKNFVIIESFDSKEDAQTVKTIAMDGTIRFKKLSQGWSGSFVLQRTNNVMDNYIALQEASYYQGLDQNPITISETITEIDGTISQYQYTNVVLTMDDAGQWSGTEIVRQRISFMGARRQELV